MSLSKSKTERIKRLALQKLSDMDRRYGRRQVYIYSGALGIVIFSVLVFTYAVVFSPVSTDDVLHREIIPEKFYLTSGGEQLVVESNGVKYYANASLWGGPQFSNNYYQQLQNSESCRIWVSKGDSPRILGLQVGNAGVSVKKGIEQVNTERRHRIWLFSILLVVSFGIFFYGKL